jgi:hypothetical protein
MFPDEFVAVIVYGVAAETAVGTPEINPVEVLNPNPLGSVGEIA